MKLRMPTVNGGWYGERSGLAAAKSDLVGEQEVMEVTEIQVTLVVLYTTTPRRSPPTTGRSSSSSSFPCSMTPELIPDPNESSL